MINIKMNLPILGNILEVSSDISKTFEKWSPKGNRIVASSQGWVNLKNNIFVKIDIVDFKKKPVNCFKGLLNLKNLK